MRTEHSTPESSNPSLERVDGRDRDLLDAVARHDRGALESLYRDYHARLFKFAFRLTRSHSTADEVVNDVMLAVWKSADRFRGSSRVSTWIYGIAYRQSLKRLRRKNLALAPEFDPDSLAAEERVDVEAEDWVSRGLEQLPAAQQMAMILVFYVGMSYEEVAEVTDCPVNTVKTRMFHARRKLKGVLEDLATLDHVE